MIKSMFSQVVEAISVAPDTEKAAADRDMAVRLATAVLLIDVAWADHVFHKSELDRLQQLIESHFGIDPERVAELVRAASEEADELVSIFEFTQTLHKYLDEKEKARIVSMLWQVAYADGELHKYEDSLVLKISDLLHVSRGRVMRLKHDAELAAN